MDRSPSAKRSLAPTFDNLQRARPFDAIGIGIGPFNLTLAALLAPTSARHDSSRETPSFNGIRASYSRRPPSDS